MRALSLSLSAFLLAGAAGAANAAAPVIPLGGSTTFAQQVSNNGGTYDFAFDLASLTPQLTFRFFNDPPGNGNQSFANISLAQFTENGTTLLSSFGPGPIASGSVFPVTGSFQPLPGGDYVLRVSATRPAGENGAAFFNVQVSAVPEPHEWAMLLSGLGLVGWIAKRRREPSREPAPAAA